MRKIEISHRTIIFTVAFLLGLWFLYQIRDVILAVFVAFLVATAIKPIVDQLTRLRIPRTLSILVSYVVVLGGLVGVVATIIHPLIEQTTALASKLPDYFSSLGIAGLNQQAIGSQLANLGTIPVDVARFVVSVFSNLIGMFAILVLAFYWLLERGDIEKRLTLLFGESKAHAVSVLDRLETQLGGWVRGELILMVIVGILTYIGLFLLNIEYALPLALLAGILEIIPNVGPIVAAIPAVVIGFTISPVIALVIALLYFVINQVENSIIVPKVMEKSVGLPPIIILIALGVGLKLGGILGAILAVPILIILRVAFVEFNSRKKLLQ